jgi:hypothetical protein
LHPSAIKEHRERDEAEGDHNEDDAAPVKIGLVPAGFILLLRVTIGLRHGIKTLYAQMQVTMKGFSMQRAGRFWAKGSGDR